MDGGTVRGKTAGVHLTSSNDNRTYNSAIVEGSDVGVSLEGSSSIWFGGNSKVTGQNAGVRHSSSSQVTVSDSASITGVNASGIELWGTGDLLAHFGSSITGGTAGIANNGSSSNVTTSAKITGRDYGIYGEGTSGLIKVTGATITGSTGVLFKNKQNFEMTDGKISGTGGTGINSASTGHCYVDGGTVTGTDRGINLSNGSGRTDNYVVVTGGNHGIFLSGTAGFEAKGASSITGGAYGINASESSSFTVSGSATLTGNSGCGIIGEGTAGLLTISGGNIKGPTGIQFKAGKSLIMTAGTVSGTMGAGISSETSGYCHVEGGTVTGNDRGLNILSLDSRIIGNTIVTGGNHGVYLSGSASIWIARYFYNYWRCIWNLCS